jgi:hypothetical protein
MTTHPSPAATPLTSLVEALSGLIAQGRQQALRAVDMVQVQTCWEVGRHIVEFEQGARRAPLMANGCCPRWRRP